MSSFPDRTNTALLVIDVQNAVVNSAYKRDETVANINRLVTYARTNGIPVVWVQHNDEEIVKESDEWKIVSELAPAENESIVHKNYRSSFEATVLDHVLAELGAGHLIITGAETAFCVRNTIHSAYERGYDVTIAEGAHTTNEINWDGIRVPAENIINELNLTLSEYHLPNRTVVVRSVAQIID